MHVSVLLWLHIGCESILGSKALSNFCTALVEFTLLMCYFHEKIYCFVIIVAQTKKINLKIIIICAPLT